jgi:indolepyruvate ferredoxin oxidoreductase alpha subunit
LIRRPVFREFQSMKGIALEETGKVVLLMGNEAIARGALEAGVQVCTGYPGTPSSEIIESLAQVSSQRNLYVEWSVNEKVALEVAASASLAGLRSICAMKHNGLNVASDFLLNLNLMGVEGGLLLVSCDDPSAHSSTSEQDTRLYARMADLPLLEPSTSHEAKDMARWAFSLSEEIGNVVLMRGVTRICHARGNVTLGDLPQLERKAHFSKGVQRVTHPIANKHPKLHRELRRLQEIFEDSPFNQYVGPPRPDLLIVTCGSGWLYSLEAVEVMDLTQGVGILKVGTTWPLPRRWMLEGLSRVRDVLFVEEVEPFLETNVKELAAEHSMELGPKRFFGKGSGHIPSWGEIDTDTVIDALCVLLDLSPPNREPQYERLASHWARRAVPQRVLGFCPGCPHRASFWNMKCALQMDGRDGFVTGDIGCYALGRTSAGYFLSRTSGAMGSGTGLASGFGKLSRFGFTQPVIAVCGDSTFFHAAMPALANAHYNRSSFVMVILDNGATAMTGFQPHPSVGFNAMGESTTPVDIEAVCRALGAKVRVADPFDMENTQRILLEILDDPVGAKVLILRRRCALLSLKEEGPPYNMSVEQELCLGESCGCNRLCTRLFKCPGLIWDPVSLKARIDDVICAGCGLCAQICPAGAIKAERTS